MTRITLFFVVATAVSFRLTAQAGYGFGLMIAEAQTDKDGVYNTIFLTEVVNLDSLSGHGNKIWRSLHHQKNVYTKVVRKWALEMIEARPSGLTHSADLTDLSQVDLYPDFLGPHARRANQINKRLGIKKEIAFMDRPKAEKHRASILRNTENDVTARIVRLPK